MFIDLPSALLCIAFLYSNKSILYYSILSYPVLFYPILFYPILYHSLLFYSTILCTSQIYHIPLYSVHLTPRSYSSSRNGSTCCPTCFASNTRDNFIACV